MNIQAYLDRIDYHGPLDPTAETLRALHVAHLLAVPFENLNIGMGWPIVLEHDALFEKIVLRRRGGFCYELNGLFAALLSALGFEVTMLSAGVARAAGGFRPEFDHLTLLVPGIRQGGWGVGEAAPPIPHLPSPIAWLADVGFGGSFREPLRFEEDSEQRHGQRAYRIARD